MRKRQVGGTLRRSTPAAPVRLPQAGFAAQRDDAAAALEAELRELREDDGYTTKRGFNEREWAEHFGSPAVAAASDVAALASGGGAAAVSGGGGGVASLPERVDDAEFFQQRFGYSLIKQSQLPGSDGAAPDYVQLDLWAEMPRYTREMIFLYVISRRRNTFAVAYTYEGRKILRASTVGTRGLKGGDRGIRGDGSADTGHQVMSMYLAEMMPKLRELRAAEGRPLDKGARVDVVLRVLGFYNGRQGAVRAVTDRADVLNVRYFEDITPFPYNGPKMPRGVFK